MSDYDGETSCVRKCCMRGGIIGLVLAAILFLFADYGFFSALLTGIVVAVVVAVILWFLTCRSAEQTSTQPSSISAPAPRPSAGSPDRAAPQQAPPSAAPQAAAAPAAEATPEAPAPVEPEAEEAAPAEPAAAETSTPPATAFQMQPSKPLPGQAELASRKGSWKYEGAEAKAEPAPLVSETPAPEPAAQKDAPKADAKPKRAPVAADGKPETFDAPQAGGADDLKLISGVGPKLEQTLNDLGVWHFSQVAGWRKNEIKWVDDRLKFKGRIERDDWISQAKILAKGGETEFSKRKKK